MTSFDKAAAARRAKQKEDFRRAVRDAYGRHGLTELPAILELVTERGLPSRKQREQEAT